MYGLSNVIITDDLVSLKVTFVVRNLCNIYNS